MLLFVGCSSLYPPTNSMLKKQAVEQCVKGLIDDDIDVERAHKVCTDIYRRNHGNKERD